MTKPTHKLAGIIAPIFICMFIAAMGTASASSQTREAEIVSKWNALKPTHTGSVFEVTPSASAPYTAGKLKSGAIRDATNMLNFMRYLADLPTDVTLTAANNEKGQHGAVLLAALDKITHAPSQPSDMSDSFYAIGRENCETSNLFQVYGDSDAAPWESIAGYMDDSDTGNIDRLGHRRWILNPSMQHSGIGFAEGKPNAYGKVFYTTLYSFDMSRKAEVAYDTVCWPNGPVFPTEYLAGDHAWSLTLNPSVYEAPSAANVKVTLTNDAGKVWRFSSANTDKNGRYFNVNLDYFGVPNCIVFRPDGITDYSGTYTVSVTGLRKNDGTSATVKYDVRFFSLTESASTRSTTSATTTSKSTTSNPTTTTESQSDAKNSSGKVYNLKTGKSFRISPTIDGKVVSPDQLTWRSGNSKIVQINAKTGAFKTIAKGSTRVYYTTQDKAYEGYFVINVT